MSEERYNITVNPGDRTIKAAQNSNLLEVLHQAGYTIPSPCGGLGNCGKCWLWITEGTPSPTDAEMNFFSEEELQEGIRLACRTEISRNLTVNLPGGAQPIESKAVLNKTLRNVIPELEIQKTHLNLPSPGRTDQRPDTKRLKEELNKDLEFSLHVLRKVASTLREQSFEITVTFADDGTVLDLDPGNTTDNFCGVAFDIGTTTVAGYCIDLNSGQEMSVHSMPNPQAKHGADVISRIKYARENEQGLATLQKAIVQAINKILQKFYSQRNIQPEQIYKTTFVGNPTMLHILAGLNPTNLDHSPYIPTLQNSTRLFAREIGLNINSNGFAYLLPALSGYVGADVLAGTLFTQIHKSEELRLLVDIGTNGEIILGNEDRLLAASTAAGPAFEGANITQGMTARSGAISHVKINNQNVELEIINNATPRGICGSGLVDSVGELLKEQAIAPAGNFSDDLTTQLKERFTEINDQQVFVLADSSEPVYITQRDVRELQLAKGSIRAGIEVLLAELNATKDDIEEIYLAGAFGNYLNKENVIRIGILPEISQTKITPVGNSAGQGAKLALINKSKKKEFERLSEILEYIELSFRSDFSDQFITSMRFPQPSK